ncbi:hypothetical protein KDL01_15955 [Actinospica durhamensis]|uniref:Uncharacterized protein n=1 Tax=Actinospica durhamensis TaxID=1508375 RepID=A0A941ELT8_9ACTN|nr:hypothetical protein [Actinospica durhamensis]MBR7834770.1 hypothetical protein [Actinospica durhamensis]
MSEHIDPPGAESAGPSPEDAGLSVDERFAKLVAGIDGSAVPEKGAKEESARTRRLRSEWAVNPPKAVAWRADGPATAADAPASRSGSGSWYSGDAQAPAKRRRRVGKPITIVLIVAVLCGGVYGVGHIHYASTGPLNALPAGTAAPWAASVSPSPSPSASPSPSVHYANPDDAYFAGSPAAGWKENEAGFTIPKAVGLNGVSRSDVATGFQQLYKLITAADLDAKVLDGGSVADFTNLVDPSTDIPKELASWIAHPSAKNDPTALVTRFDPATTRLLGHTVKVSGSMTEQKGKHKDSVDLIADYVFVYAVAPASDAQDATRVTVHRTLEIEVYNPADYNVVAGKAWLLDWDSYLGDIQCYDNNGYVDPGFGGSGGEPNETGVADPYATGNLLTQAPDPQATSSMGECQASSVN